MSLGRKAAIISLGCPRNLVDSETIVSNLKLKGWRIVESAENADVAIVNTCAFINEAKKESIDVILDLVALKKEGRLGKIIVCGCLSERYKKELPKELPEVDAFVGKLALDPKSSVYSLTPRHYAYLKICESCINNCSYCIIPKIKGRFVSLEAGNILDKVKVFDKKKISELNIIGQDITGYGIDLYGKYCLAKLLKQILKASRNIGWFRLLYLYPSRLSDELLKLIAQEKRICKYIDLPLQHINDRVLKAMNRGMAKKDIVKLIEKIRKNIPGVALRSAFIVGFPSETDAEFRELLKFIEDVRFERLGVFTYSREEGTKAFDFGKQIPDKIKQDRFDEIMSKQQEISRSLNASYLGRTIDVLIDQKDKSGYLGRTQYDAPEVDGLVYIKSKINLKPGDFVKAKIIDTLEYDLVAQVV